MKFAYFLQAAALFALAACGTSPDRPRGDRSTVVSNWRATATTADRERLRNWRIAWTAALDEVRKGGKSALIAQQGALLDPDRALPLPLPPAGDYRCRVFKLGSKGTPGAGFIAYPYYDCRITDEGEVLSLHKRSGSQRTVGLVFKDTDARGIFLGTLVLGDETMPLQYGQDAARDMAGVVERIGERRWRLVLPYPAFESLVDVIELVPAG